MLPKILLPAVALVLVSCGSAGAEQSLSDPDVVPDFDSQLGGCLLNAGVDDPPLENVDARLAADSEYSAAFEQCVKTVAPNQADEILAQTENPLERINATNDQLARSIDCAVSDGGFLVDDPLPRDDSGYISLDRILVGFGTDRIAYSFLQSLARCGGPPAPEEPASEFSVQRECITHSHDGEAEHSHGRCD